VPNIYQNIDNNKRETVVIIALFIAVVSFMGWFVGEYYEPGAGYFMMAIALIFSGLSSFVSYYNSDKIVLGISGAHEVKATDSAAAGDLFNLVENVCIAAGLPMPKIYIIQDTALNAFATGRDPGHAAVCFTTGIIQSLEKRELEGVVAHELSHVGNFDIRLMSIVTILVGTITLIADWFTRGRLYGGDRRDRGSSEVNGLLLLIGLLFIVLSPIIATLIKMAVSRNREYLADSTAALITRYPRGLANALKKLAADREILEAANGATAHLYISSPLRGETGGFLAGLFDTHPPIAERIKRLEAM
jgi:heat shock protein HtpX